MDREAWWATTVQGVARIRHDLATEQQQQQYIVLLGFPGGSVVKNLSATTRDGHSFPGSGRSSGEGNGNPLQYSCPGNPMDKRAWWATVHGIAKEWDIT